MLRNLITDPNAIHNKEIENNIKRIIDVLKGNNSFNKLPLNEIMVEVKNYLENIRNDDCISLSIQEFIKVKSLFYSNILNNDRKDPTYGLSVKEIVALCWNKIESSNQEDIASIKDYLLIVLSDIVNARTDNKVSCDYGIITRVVEFTQSLPNNTDNNLSQNQIKSSFDTDELINDLSADTDILELNLSGLNINNSSD